MMSRFRKPDTEAFTRSILDDEKSWKGRGKKPKAGTGKVDFLLHGPFHSSVETLDDRLQSEPFIHLVKRVFGIWETFYTEEDREPHAGSAQQAAEDQKRREKEISSPEMWARIFEDALQEPDLVPKDAGTPHPIYSRRKTISSSIDTDSALEPTPAKSKRKAEVQLEPPQARKRGKIAKGKGSAKQPPSQKAVSKPNQAAKQGKKRKADEEPKPPLRRSKRLKAHQDAHEKSACLSTPGIPQPQFQWIPTR